MKNVRPRLKKGPKQGPQGPPKNALQNRHPKFKIAQMLIYKRFWHLGATPKFELENWGGSKKGENRLFRKDPRFSKKSPPGRQRSDSTNSSKLALFGQAGGPKIRQFGRARQATAGRPKVPKAKWSSQAFRTVTLPRPILI